MTFIRETHLTPHQARELVKTGFILTLVSIGKMWDLYHVFAR